ncbi:MAG: hypothetical protein ACK444_04900 [Flavobacteriales bacterium]|jgi:hypothetical protein
MKNILTFFSIFFIIASNAKSKNEQPDSLNLSVESFNSISSLNDHIEQSNQRIDTRKNEVKLWKDSDSLKVEEIERKYNVKNGLRQPKIILIDSIKNTNLLLDTILWEIPDSITWDQLEFNLKLIIPKDQFNTPKGNLLISKDNSIIISYEYNHTHSFEDYIGIPLFYKEQDAINYYSKGLKDIEITNNDGFIIKGKNPSGQLIIIKGFYGEFASMQGRDEGEPAWLWSNTLIIKITENKPNKKEFEYLSSLIINSFSTQSIIYKY